MDDHSDQLSQSIFSLSEASKTKETNPKVLGDFLCIYNNLQKNSPLSTHSRSVLAEIDFSTFLPFFLRQNQGLNYPAYKDHDLASLDPIRQSLLQSLTLFRAVQGKLALYNKSITYLPAQKTFFPECSSDELYAAEQDNRFHAQLQFAIGKKSQAKAYNFVADLFEQEMCLRKNAKNKQTN
jgi:hypothetical protein